MTTIDPRLEAEYNNRLKVPEHLGIMAGWARDAEVYRAASAHAELGLAYGPSERQALDIFWPGPDRTAPLAMFVHGGYWQGLDRSWFSHLARGFLHNGVALALPSYDLCPHVTLDVLVDQVRRAAGFVIARHGRDVYATGHSAGGHLAAMLLATDWPRMGVTQGRVSGACAISGLFDLGRLLNTSINGALGLDEVEARRLSPVNLPAPAGSIHAVVGEREGEDYLWQSQAIAEAWAGTWHVAPGANHFTVIDPLRDPQSPLIRTILGRMTDRSD